MNNKRISQKKRALLTIFLIPVMIIGTLLVISYLRNPDGLSHKSVRSLNAASTWFIEEGLSLYYQKGEDRDILRNKMNKDWDVSLWETPIYDADNSIQVKVGFGTRVAHTIRLESVNQDVLYEYWMISHFNLSIKQDSQKVVIPCRFILTRTKDTKGKREILKNTIDYFRSYQKPDGSLITLSNRNLGRIPLPTAGAHPNCHPQFD
ncbi:MAG: hypothetical protein V7776_11520 [Halopseudomonas aestusnigri]